MRTYNWVTATAGVIMVSLVGCSSGAATPSASDGDANPFAGNVGGNLRTSGFNPSDEVGQSRADHAASKLSGLTVTMDKTNFDAQKFAAQAAAGQRPT